MAAGLTAVAADGPAVDPVAYLRAMRRAPRGFWRHAGRWAVFGGSAAALERPAEARFRDVSAGAADLLRTIVGDGGEARLFGGFAFGAEPARGDRWNAFPGARLTLPCLSVHGGATGVRLVGYGVDAGAAAERLEHTIAAVERAGTADSAFLQAEPLPARVDAYEAWAVAVRAVLAAIARGEVQKVVLARALDVRFAAPPDPVGLLQRVLDDNPDTTVYYLEPAPGVVLLGAAPEVLVTLDAGRFLTTAVAGSTGRGRTPAEDETLAQRLLGSPKERAEHGFGVDDIVSRLSPFTEHVEIEPRPRILRLHRIQHLETDISARVSAETTALDLVAALHPTAAVAGVPREAATALLQRVESLERGWYAGPVGWCDARGNGEFAPALRCALGRGTEWRLFAGAGIVAGSDPDREWSETAMKFQPMLHALGTAGA